MAIDLGAAPRTTWRAATRSSVALRSAFESHHVDASLLASSVTVGALIHAEPAIPPAAFLLPVGVAGWVLPARRARVVFIAIMAVYAAVAVTSESARSFWMFLPILGGAMILARLATLRWTPLGVVPAEGGRMLADLHHRMQVQGALPEGPDGWTVERAVKPASGGSFSGDVVAGRAGAQRYDLVLADVSGVGSAAATRAAMLGSAASCLLGSAAVRDYLPALNDHLFRQEWEDGFATAAHVHLNTLSGALSVGSAGHPAALHFDASRREWALLRGACGVALGLLDDLHAHDYPRVDVVLEPGDLLVLYTDGVVESAGRDLMAGVDALVAAADDERADGIPGLADRIADRLDCCEQDDRTVVVIGRG